MRFVLVALLAVVAVMVSGCGSGLSAPHEAGPPPGKIEQRNGPPRTWLETATGSTWLDNGSYCWSFPGHSVCADMIAPSCSSAPRVKVTAGEMVHTHLGFEPEEASVDGTRATPRGRTVSWKATRGGPFMLFAKTRRGDASYIGCAVLTTKPSAYSGPA
jgi:hypothetical protein